MRILREIGTALRASCMAFCWILTMACLPGSGQAADLDDPVEFDIPAQSLDSALVQFSLQAKMQITSPAPLLKGLTSSEVVGKYRVTEALARLLQHSGLSYKLVNGGTIAVGKFPRNSAAAHPASSPPAAPSGELVPQRSDPAPASERAQRRPDVDPEAGSGGAVQLEEVVVNARKRTENLQDVPISVTAFSAADLENFGFRSVQDISFSVPNFTWGRLTTISEIICIRGICSDSSASGFDTSIGVILDDVYVGRASGFATSLIDIEQVEVLRGPQGTLQGRNATGGAINITTAAPTSAPSALFDLSYGNYNQVIAQGSVSGPIADDTLTGKLAVSRRSHDGFETNIDLNKPLDTEDSYALRGQLQFKPREDLRILLTGDIDHFNNHDFHNAYGPPDVGAPPPEFFTRTVGGNIQNYGSREVFGGAMNVYWTTPIDATLVSVTSYRGFQVVDVQDASGQQNFGPAGAGTVLGMGREDQRQRQFSQELRLVSPAGRRLTWLAGLYYYWEKLFDYQNFLYGLNTGTVVNGSASIDAATLYTNSVAGFGSVTWDISRLFSVTGGLRDTRNSRHVTMQEVLGIDGTATAPDGSSFTYVNMPTLQNPVPTTFQSPVVFPLDHNSLTDRQWTGDLTFTQHWIDDLSTYERYAHGFKGGGFNANFNNGSGAGVVKPEFMDSFEIGLRSEYFDRRLRVNATTFYLKQRDQQVLVFDTILNLYVTSNAPSTTSYGEELDISGAITHDLIASLAVGVTDAKFKAGQWAGNLVPYTSPVSITSTLQYTHPLTSSLEFFGFTDVNWHGGYYTSPDDQPVSHQKSYVWMDGRAGIQAPGGRWSVGMYVRNALDTNVLAFGLNNPGVYTVGFIQEPRTYGVDARIRF